MNFLNIIGELKTKVVRKTMSGAQKEFDDIGEVFTTAVKRYSDHAESTERKSEEFAKEALALEKEATELRESQKELEAMVKRSKATAGRIEALFSGDSENLIEI